MIDTDTDAPSVTIQATEGRDAGKAFKILEVPPIEMAGFVLRVLNALRLNDQSDLLELFTPSEGAEVDTRTVLSVLTGCDPAKMHGLITDALKHVHVAPDPKHPGAFRPLNAAEDIKEMRTLGALLGAFARKNLMRAP